jgi:hypothetical protein
VRDARCVFGRRFVENAERRRKRDPDAGRTAHGDACRRHADAGRCDADSARERSPHRDSDGATDDDLEPGADAGFDQRPGAYGRCHRFAPRD